ncbi:MAG: 2-amino-4-hydroxy-6-hydroxymethyldihydropteridine diphosphokinase [Pseudomonadota bacterium]|nr:2-amino-4-hydroxy-6-hydroxymethyldihydropteridine diphosphokinase [Pseudomonadota bacterium]
MPPATADAIAPASCSPRAVHAFVGIGSNLAQPLCQIRRAVEAIAQLPQTCVVARSSLYRSAPLGVIARQPHYINAVACVATTLSADALLRALQGIERAQRRRRSTPGAPRSLDLDLLTYGAHQRLGRRLRLPHPRLHRRAFVLKPLLEIAPGIAIPGRGRASKFLPRARSQRVSRMTSS